jgi:small-conductance mechanosensitive channel
MNEIDDSSIALYQITLYDILFFVIVISVSVIVARILRKNITKVLKGKVSSTVLNILENVVYYTVIAVGIISGLPRLGIDLTGLLVAGGVAGIVIGFASQSVVSNLLSGLFLLIEQPIKIGDQIQVGDTAGVVVDMQVLSTTLRTYEGAYVRIPNETVFSSEITNVVTYAVRRLQYTVGISYDDDAEMAVTIIKTVVNAHPFVLVNPPPTVFVDALGESSVDLVVRVWTPSSVWYEVKRELLLQIKVALEKNGITIPFPQRVLHISAKDQQ